MTKKFMTLAIVGAAVSIALVGCSASAPADNDAPSAAEENELYATLPQDIRDAGKIVFAANILPPWLTETDGKLGGANYELAEAIGEVLGVEVEIQKSENLAGTLTGMTSGRFDVVPGPIKLSKERLEQFDGVQWARSEAAFVTLTDAKYEKAEELCGKTIAAASGNTSVDRTKLLSEWCVNSGEDAVDLLELATSAENVVALNSGRADAYATTSTTAADIVSRDKAYSFVNSTLEQGNVPDELGLVTVRGDGLAESLYEALKVLFEDGRYAELMAKFGQTQSTIEAPVLNPEVASS